MINLSPMGDRAVLARFESEDAAIGWAAAVRAWCKHRPEIEDVVLAYRSVGVYFAESAQDVERLERELASLQAAERADEPGMLVELPVLYDGEDLDIVAAHAKVSRADVGRLHARAEYRVYAIGFMPGFPYAGYLEAPLAGMARRSTPRKSVAAGSVAIAARQTGVYPGVSPGGWHLIGRTPLVIADMASGHFPIRAGDRLRFVPIDGDEFHQRQGQRLEVAGRVPITE
jgi:KipI family sensor histidine kinase inhibitor